ncbi:DUF3742 family protein [Burkholderia pseudomallei]
MTTTSRPSWAHRFGEWAGHTWRWLARQDRRALGWLTKRGLSSGAAKAVSWAVKLLVLSVVLYAAFWLVLVFVLGLAAAWVAQNKDWDAARSNEAEWRHGPAGYGLYTNDDYRIDPHDPEDEHR